MFRRIAANCLDMPGNSANVTLENLLLRQLPGRLAGPGQLQRRPGVLRFSGLKSCCCCNTSPWPSARTDRSLSVLDRSSRTCGDRFAELLPATNAHARIRPLRRSLEPLAIKNVSAFALCYSQSSFAIYLMIRGAHQIKLHSLATCSRCCIG